MRPVEERSTLALRLRVLQWMLTAVFLALAVCFWYLQVAQHTEFLETAENNHRRTLALDAPRGVVFDRSGEVLVENRYARNISIVRDRPADVARTSRLLAEIAGVPPDAIHEAIERSRGVPRYRPVVVIRDATLAQVAAVMARRYELPNVVVEQVPVRVYPAQTAAAHVLGYVGEVSERELARQRRAIGSQGRGRDPALDGGGAADVAEARAEPAGRRIDLRLGDIIGQTGLERQYNELLMGEHGARFVRVNSLGREVAVDRTVEPVPGQRVQLTIDLDVQRAAERAFAQYGYSGTAVALDPRNGEVLAMTSVPAFDPNDFASGIDQAAWDALRTDPLRPLQNRALQGRYSPGSTFKIVVAIAALAEGIVEPTFRAHCAGGGTFHGRYFRCWRRGGHGTIDLQRALERSCNVYFYTLGQKLGVDRIHAWATKLGLGPTTGVDLPHEIPGIVPSTTWKKETTGQRWYPGETISVAIGQGPLSVTPMQLALMMATIANGGTRVVPHLLKAIDDGEGWHAAAAPPPREMLNVPPDMLEAVKHGLWLVVNGGGTGGRARIDGYDVAGKTGTAQVISVEGAARAAETGRDLRDHGWFVFFAPADEPRIAGVVLAEHSGHGYLAAPIAKHMMQVFFAKREGRPLPVLSAPAIATAREAGE